MKPKIRINQQESGNIFESDYQKTINTEFLMMDEAHKNIFIIFDAIAYLDLEYERLWMSRDVLFE